MADPLNRRLLLQGSAALGAGLAAPTLARGEGGGGADDPTHRLWYRQPATRWVEALPVGNGRLGAMVFGGTGHERLQLNEDSFWAGGPYDPVNPEARAALPEVRRLIDAGRYAEAQALADAKLMARPLTQMPYQPIGDLLIDLPGLGETSGYRRSLDLDGAVATTRFTADGVVFERRVLASPVDQVIAVRITASRRGAIDATIAFSSPQRAAVAATADRLTLTGQGPASKGIAGVLRFVAVARVLPHGGTLDVEHDRLAVRGADAITVLVAIATSHRRFDDAGGEPEAIVAAQVARAAARPIARIVADAAAVHRRLYRRVALDLGRTAAADQPTDARIVARAAGADDPALATLYFNFGRYLLIACSRPGGQPANLQGLWNEGTDPPWGSKYTININTEMNYWPAEPLALGECVAPLLAMVQELAETGARTAREMYGARGWVAHHNTDLWRATAPVDGAAWGLWPMGGAWLCTQLWDHYDYGRDPAWLRAIYPLMRGSAQFFLDTLQRDPVSGALVTNPSLSPENAHVGGASLCAAPAMDGQILRDLFDQTQRAEAILGGDAEFAAAVGAARARLAPDKIGAQGQLQEWQQDWDAAAPEPHHRHVSHLYALFPSQQIDPDRTPALARAARRSLELRGDESTGWATAWRACLWARLRDGEHAHRILSFLVGPERTYPDLFDAHPPFQIDGNFGGARAIAEMLMQSRDGEILLLPALPRAWPTGAVSGLRARGGIEVAVAWRGGRLAQATLRADRGGDVAVRLGERRVELRLVAGRPVRLAGETLRRA